MGGTGRHEDLINFDQSQIVMTNDWVRVCLKQQGLWDALTVRGLRRDKRVGHLRLIDVQGNKDHSAWSEPTDGLLWHKTEIFLMMVMGGMCHSAWHHAAYKAA